MKQRIFASVGIAAMMAVLAGCDEIKFNGSLGVTEPMTFTQSRGPANGRLVEVDLSRAGGSAVLNPGQYSTKIIMGQSGQDKQMTMEVSNANPATVIKMKFDKNINLGENFTLTAAQLGQNFDLVGNLITKVTRTPEESAWEYCTTQYPQTVCRSAKSADPAAEKATAEISKLDSKVAAGEIPSVPNPQYRPYPGQFPGQYPGQFNNPPVYAPNCSTVWVNRPGNMQVRFYYETTTRDINAKFVQGEKNLANYVGQASDTRKVNTYQGSCY